jgi:threonine dehydratase
MMTTELYQPTAEATLESALALVSELHDQTSEWHHRFYDAERGIKPTPTWQMPETTNGHHLLIKDETSHRVSVNGKELDVASFKRRGAWAGAVADLRQGELMPDVLVAASAGNHAYGISVAAALLGMRAEIYGKHTMSSTKRKNNEDAGATVITHDSLEDAIFAAELAEGLGDDGLVRKNIHPFDSQEVIAGQSTMVDEWLSSLEASQAAGEIDLHHDQLTVVVPIGGGGLISGWALGLELARQHGRIGENVRLVGAQMERCDAMNRALKKGDEWNGSATLRVDQLNAMNDGTAVLKPGSLTFDIVRQHVDDIVVLTPAEVGRAMHDLSDTLCTDVEPAGALGYAAAQKLVARPHADPDIRSFVTCVASGANISDETKQYFNNEVQKDAARQSFKALSDSYLAQNVAYDELEHRAFDLTHATSRSRVASAPTSRRGLITPERQRTR